MTPALVRVQDNFDNTYAFTFNTTVGTYITPDQFNVDGNDGQAFTNAPGSNVVLVDFGADLGTGVPYQVNVGAVAGFGSGGTPAYPLVGTVT